MWIVDKLKIRRLRKIWRDNNSHNSTNIVKPAFMECITVGKYTYGRIDAQISSNHYKLVIGNFCSIADNVKFILGSDHKYTCLSSFPFNTRIVKDLNILDSTGKGDIIIDDDVWIGYGATILSGVHISQGAVVAAGSVITKDVPPYAIVGGVPDKVIKYRFEPDMIEELLKIDYSKLTKEDIEKHIYDLYVELTDKRQFDWMPKKGEYNE